MTYGSGQFTYELVDKWASLPNGETLRDVPGLKIDSKGNSYLFTRGKHPIMVFDSRGNLSNEELDKEKAVLLAPHSLVVASKGNIYMGQVSTSFARIDRTEQAVKKFKRV